MLFNSFSFLIFFPVVVILYYLFPYRWRTLLLLAASVYFYMAFVPQYILILFFLITVDFFLAQSMEKRTERKRKIFLIGSILANLGVLFVFKYFNFFNQNIAVLANFLHWNYSPLLLKVVLPLGLSFHVFQSLSYVIEVYRGRYRAEKNYLTYALYVMFFPQLVAGPIERPYHLLPQLKLEHRLNPDNIKDGLERMLWGFFKKIVIADNLALYVNQVFLHPHDYSGSILVVATIFFAVEIYCDFSGYSDIAIGSARVLGIGLIENFNYPYLSRSMSEYWRRWHMSLSNWLRDYLYYPLALSIKASAHIKLYAALFITMVLIGLWHGANWTFIAFGALHGLYLTVGQATKNLRERFVKAIGLMRFERLYAVWQTTVTFALACVGFIFFRANSLGDALYITIQGAGGILSLLDGIGGVVASVLRARLYPLSSLLNSLLLDGEGRRNLIFLFGLILLLAGTEIMSCKGVFASWRTKWPQLKWIFYFIAVISIMNLGVTHEIPFIYFQF